MFICRSFVKLMLIFNVVQVGIVEVRVGRLLFLEIQVGDDVGGFFQVLSVDMQFDIVFIVQRKGGYDVSIGNIVRNIGFLQVGCIKVCF